MRTRTGGFLQSTSSTRESADDRIQQKTRSFGTNVTFLTQFNISTSHLERTKLPLGAHKDAFTNFRRQQRGRFGRRNNRLVNRMRRKKQARRSHFAWTSLGEREPKMEQIFALTAEITPRWTIRGPVVCTDFNAKSAKQQGQITADRCAQLESSCWPSLTRLALTQHAPVQRIA